MSLVALRAASRHMHMVIPRRLLDHYPLVEMSDTDRLVAFIRRIVADAALRDAVTDLALVS